LLGLHTSKNPFVNLEQKMDKIIQLKPEREKSLLRHHPWVYSGAIQRVMGEPESGDTIAILDAKGEFLAWGAYSPLSQIRARVWSWAAEEKIDELFWRRQISTAIQSRKEIPDLQATDAKRIVFSESDGMPGLVVDQYGQTLCIQITSAGIERHREKILDLLIELMSPDSIYERSDVDVRSIEGLPARTGLLWGKPIDAAVHIQENGLRFEVDVRQGHKTGFYLDQRQNRFLTRQLGQGKRVLDCFCYTGGFTTSVLAADAMDVTAVDSSAPALEAVRQHIRLNQLDDKRVTLLQGDVFQVLRQMRDRGAQFDLIILDPPKFAPTSAQVQRAARGYKDINLLALKLLAPRGRLVTFSCSGGFDRLLFQKIVAGAALDAGVSAQILYHLSQSPDHPVSLDFPEGEYLKGLVLQKTM
jgi:23S rRNA (cytosine1962-C5)-methyltransferase